MAGQRIVILHSFIKKTQATPKRELATAIQRMNQVKHGRT
jgi:phage-related protein